MSNDLDEMDAPCRCDCGEWFDQSDGWENRNSNVLVCDLCHKKDMAVKKLEQEIISLEMEIENLDGEKNVKRKISELKKQIDGRLRQIDLLEY